MNVGLNGAPYSVEWAQKTRNLVEVGSAQSFFEYFKISTYRYIFKVIFIVSSLCFHSQLMLCGWNRRRNEWETEYLAVQFGTFHFHLHALHQQLQFSEQFSAAHWRVHQFRRPVLAQFTHKLCVFRDLEAVPLMREAFISTFLLSHCYFIPGWSSFSLSCLPLRCA